MSQPSELFAALNALYHDVPPNLRWLAVADELYYSGRESVPGAKSWIDVYRATRKDVVIGVFGGTYLEHGVLKEDRRYYHLNQRLAELMVARPRPDGKRGWSFATGQGPGKAMAGPHYCLREARSAYASDQESESHSHSKCIGVPSGLQDETPHPYTDPEFTVRPQEDTLLRELMLFPLAIDGLLVYPGWKGSFCELFLGMFNNYCAGRAKYGLPPVPIIVVDQPSEPARDLNLVGDSYFGFLKELDKNATRMGLTKPGAGSGVGVEVVEVTWRDAPELILACVERGLISSGRMKPDSGD